MPDVVERRLGELAGARGGAATAGASAVAAPVPIDGAVAATGLTCAEARARLATHGPNEALPPRHARGLWRSLVQFASPLVLVLLGAAAVSALLGEVVNAALIAIAVALSVVLGSVQSHRSRRAAEALRSTVAPTATVRRDGSWLPVPRREVVPGDVIRLAAGDLVPADALLLVARDLHVQEAVLTGESLPVEKEARGVVDATGPNRDGRHVVHLGSSVVSGTAQAVVTATGPHTALGEIAAKLGDRPPETEFERGIRRFGEFITRLVLLLVFFLLLAGILRHRDPLESLLFAVALAVGLVPEFLPMITSVTLAAGAVHMARARVIVRHLEAIQNFGSIDVLCSDKTGTLTGGELRLEEWLDSLGASSTAVLELARDNSRFQTGIQSPLDAAILTGAPAESAPARKVDEVPFDFERRRLSVVLERDGRRVMVTKGAPEGVLAVCGRYDAAGGIRPLDDDARAKVGAVAAALGARGMRVLAVAWSEMPEQPAYAAADEHDLTLAGFLAFVDPPLADTAGALEALRRDGVEVKILTGDTELVTRHVCARVGVDPGRIVLGDEVERTSDAELTRVAERTRVFARVTPAQKHRIVLALKRGSHVVGFLGDGINDAPSLHAADVGISVASAVDVAREAADIVLLERRLDVLHAGIVEGRKAFGNVMKYLLMGTSSNFGNMFSMAGAALFLPFLPMRPTQILINNLLYDVAQLPIPTDTVDAAYTRRPHHWDIGVVRDFMLRIGPLSSIFDFLTFWVLLVCLRASAPVFQTGWFVESLVTQTLVLFVIRTAGNPLRSRPSPPLALTTVAVAATGLVLPFTRAGRILGLVPLPAAFFAVLAAIVACYLLVVEVAKRRLMRRVLA